MISIVVASSALAMGSNVTFEMHVRIRNDDDHDDDHDDNYHRNTLCVTSVA